MSSGDRPAAGTSAAPYGTGALRRAIPARALRGSSGVARAVARAIRAVIGVLDYERYVAHLRLHHPDRAPITCGEFTREQLEARYSRPGSRCC